MLTLRARNRSCLDNPDVARCGLALTLCGYGFNQGKHRDYTGDMVMSIAKPNPKRPPRQVFAEHEPTPKLERALRDLRDGRYVEYDSVEAIEADIQRHKEGLRRK